MTGIFIVVSFAVGSWVYVSSIALPRPVQLKDFRAAILQAGSHDTTVTIGDQKFIVTKAQVVEWTETYVRLYSGKDDLRFSQGLGAFVANIGASVAKDPIDARFTIQNGKAQVFVPEQSGQRLNIEAASSQLNRALLANESEVVLTLDTVEPGITLDKINSLGISGKIATGESDFIGSTRSRIQNIKVSSQLFNGAIIKPGETFSFNAILGPVDETGGYLPEKVIKNHEIAYEYGGGICQVSTTLFRAAILAGFPIVERKPHAFPVHYYEPQGFDATIYPGVSDMRFVNDSPNHVLIQTRMKGTELYFDLYGTDTKRTVTVDGPHQYDRRTDGSMKAYFVRTITYPDGSSKEEKFTSVYRSPSLYPTELNPYE